MYLTCFLTSKKKLCRGWAKWFKVSLRKIRLAGFRYVFGKNYGWSLCVAKNMHKIFGGCVVAFQSAFYLEIHQNNIFFIFKKLFLISAHQNNLKTQKYIISCVMLRVELFF
jgi:hypothetical protein